MGCSRRRHLPALLLLLHWLLAIAPAVVVAKTTLEVEAGYDNRFRPGRWSPVILTVSHDKPLTAEVELRVANASTSVMNIRQAIGVGPQEQTYVMYAPLAMMFDPVRVTLTDPATRKVLARWPDENAGGINTRFGFGGEQVGFFSVTAGRAPVMQGLNYERGGGTTIVSHQPQRVLPVSAMGYDSIDLLYLNNPEWTGLTVDQQQAMVDWVGAGGQLIIWPGIEPLPADAPLARVLPATVGEVVPLTLDAAALKAAGLPKRFGTLTRRSLAPSAGATMLPLLGGQASAAWGRVGMGSITVMPVDASLLQFERPSQFNAFWRDLLKQAVDWRPLSGADPAPSSAAASIYQMEDVTAAHVALDVIGANIDAGTFGFSYILIVVGLMMLIVGPVDFFILKKIGRQPWTWVTTLGWIGLITVGAIYAGYLLRSGDLHFRTLTLTEQAGEQVVSQNQVALIYAPRSNSYSVESTPTTWWQPVPRGHRYGNAEFAMPVDLHQDYRGTRPEPMWIDVWDWRFLQGRRTGAAPPMLSATLRRDGDRITGTIVNHTPHALSGIQLAWTSRSALLSIPCPAGESIDVDVTLSERQLSARGVELDQGQDVQYGAGYRDLSHGRYQDLFAINRAETGTLQRLDHDPARAAGVVTVYATLEGIPPETTISDATALQQHLGMVRGIFELQP